MNKINEGLRKNDLEDLILPYISIDEYKSKIADNNEIVVVGFFVEDKEPAKELSKFIDRSIETILDTDVSPAPTEAGYFMVFVEIPRDQDFYKVLSGLLKEIKNITNIDKWTFKTYKNDEILDFNKENVQKNIRINQPTHESFELSRFFDNALVDDIQVYPNHIKINELYFKVIDINNNLFLESSWNFGDLSFSRRLDTILGLNYNTYVNQNKIQVYNKVLNRAIVLEHDS